MLTRNPRLPAEARAALAPLESLPPEAIPDTAVSAAVALAVQARPDLELDPENPKVARGNVADVFRFRDRTSESNAIAFKTVRADSLLRIQNEAAILMQRAAHFAGTFQKKVCAYAQNLLARFANPCDVPFRSSGITRSPRRRTYKQ